MGVDVLTTSYLDAKWDENLEVDRRNMDWSPVGVYQAGETMGSPSVSSERIWSWWLKFVKAIVESGTAPGQRGTSCHCGSPDYLTAKPVFCLQLHTAQGLKAFQEHPAAGGTVFCFLSPSWVLLNLTGLNGG
jgi:hypothetical protein